MRFLCFIFDGIWLKRDSKDIASLKTALKLLKSGGCIGIFPEGTRNGMEKNDGKLKNGAAYMALKTNTKIIKFEDNSMLPLMYKRIKAIKVGIIKIKPPIVGVPCLE